MSDHSPEEAPRAPEIIDHQPDAPALAPQAPPELPEPSPVVQRRGGTPLLLTLLLTAVLAGGIYWTWKHPGGEPATAPVAVDDGAAIEAAKAQLTAQIQALGGRLDALEKQASQPPATAAAPAADPSALADLARRIDGVSAALATLSTRQDAQGEEIRKLAEDAGQKPGPAGSAAPAPDAQDVAALTALVQAANGKVDQGLAQAKAELDAVNDRLAKLETAAGQAQTTTQDQAQDKSALDALNSRVAKLEAGAGQERGVAQDAALAIRLQAAQAALAAGQPLGDLPDAPPALARFASSAPPTEAALRSAFPQVADAARAVSQPDVEKKSFLDRALARVEESVTVRRGDHVIVGDPASGVLARAQDAVNNDDLAGAVAALHNLTGPAAGAAAGWVAQVQSLLAARAALAALAAHG